MPPRISVSSIQFYNLRNSIPKATTSSALCQSFRIFRLGALADALDYYRGYQYSETIEVAVVLCRLGYAVRNDVVVPVPVYRSRTRLFDVAVDLVMAPRAAGRVRAGRRRRLRARHEA